MSINSLNPSIPLHFAQCQRCNSALLFQSLKKERYEIKCWKCLKNSNLEKTEELKVPQILKSHYQVLELDEQATPAEIKKAYYALALTCHPDRHPDDPEKAEKVSFF